MAKDAIAKCVIPGRKRSDIDIIKTSITTVMANKELLKRTLIESGVYDKNLKLTASYR